MRPRVQARLPSNLSFAYQSKIDLTDQLGPEYFGGFDVGRSLLRCTRVRSENDGAPDYS